MSARVPGVPNFPPFQQDQYPATTDLTCIKVYIPDEIEYRRQLAGVLSLLSNRFSYADPDSAQAEGVADVWGTAYTLTDWEGCGTPPECQQMNTSLVMFPPTSFITSGNNFAWTNDGLTELGGYWMQSPAQTADQWRWRQYLAPGLWEYTITYFRDIARGRGDFYVTPDFSNYLENVVFDFRGALLRNAKFLGGFTVPEPGLQVYIGMDGTGASSGADFRRPIQRIEMYKYDNP